MYHYDARFQRVEVERRGGKEEASDSSCTEYNIKSKNGRFISILTHISQNTQHNPKSDEEVFERGTECLHSRV